MSMKGLLCYSIHCGLGLHHLYYSGYLSCCHHPRPRHCHHHHHCPLHQLCFPVHLNCHAHQRLLCHDQRILQSLLHCWHFLPIMESKMGQYPTKMGKMGNIPPKQGQRPGRWGICSLYLYLNFGQFFVICPSPQNGGIVKKSKVSYALDRVRFCILLMRRQSWSNEVWQR